MKNSVDRKKAWLLGITAAFIASSYAYPVRNPAMTIPHRSFAHKSWDASWESSLTCTQLMALMSGKDGIGALNLQNLITDKISFVLGLLPVFPSKFSMESLFLSEPGTYRLNEVPTIETLSSIHTFRQLEGNPPSLQRSFWQLFYHVSYFPAEIGLYRIQGQWILIIGKAKLRAGLPQILNSLYGTSLVEVSIHSHAPERSPTPFFEDLDFTSYMVSGLSYLATSQGLLELSAHPDPNFMPSRVAWSNWKEASGLTEETYYQEGPENVFARFCKEIYKMRVLPWSDEAAITSLLH